VISEIGSLVVTIGYMLVALSAVVACLNIYYLFFHRPLYRWMGWEYQWNSGGPLLGNVLLLLGILLLAPRGAFNWTWAVALLALDVGGLPWIGAMLLWNYLFDKGPRSS
jgi:hypothetical protein